MVGFKPWGIQSFLNFQTEEIINTNPDLKFVYPSEMRVIEEKLLQCDSTLERIRRFKAITGINPKLFSRLVRFQYILKLLDNAKLDLLDHAIESGFYDSSHFIHEFKEFTGMSPSEYVNENVRSNLGVYFDKQIAQSPYYHLIYQ